jgi:hypothetical protein
MDFKIKIDLLSQSIIEDTPKKEKQKKKKEGTTEKSTKKNKKEESEKKDTQGAAKNEEGKKKKKYLSKKKLKENKEDTEKPKINSNSIISLTLPNNDNTKNDQAQKLNLLTKKKPRHWEKRWVLIPNVFEFTKEIWMKKWVLVDEGDEFSENNVKYLYILEFFNTILLELYQTL